MLEWPRALPEPDMKDVLTDRAIPVPRGWLKHVSPPYSTPSALPRKRHHAVRDSTVLAQRPHV